MLRRRGGRLEGLDVGGGRREERWLGSGMLMKREEEGEPELERLDLGRRELCRRDRWMAR